MKEFVAMMFAAVLIAAAFSIAIIGKALIENSARNPESGPANFTKTLILVGLIDVLVIFSLGFIYLIMKMW